MNSKHKNKNIYCLILSNFLQKFKHKNIKIWIWKYCLLKIYLRVVEYKFVDSRGMTQSDEYKGPEFLKEEITKARERFFITLLSSSALNFFSLSQVLSCEEIGFAIYRRWSRTWVDLESSCLKFFEIHHHV